MNFNFRSRHRHISARFLSVSLTHKTTFPPYIIFPVSFRFACCSLFSYASSPSLHTVSVSLSLSLHSTPCSVTCILSVSFCFPLSDLYPPVHVLEVDWLQPARAAVCCWSCATTEALWLTRYLFV